jgi:predicted ATP-grasp superfamily ATP-dependent carboligase
MFVIPPSGGAPGKSPISTDPPQPPEGGTTNTLHAGVAGKIILYAHRDVIAPDLSRFVYPPSRPPDSTRSRKHPLPYMADIPVPGQPISRGQPICTLFARARSEAECLAKLHRRAARFEGQLR